MRWWERLCFWRSTKEEPVSARHGRLGERAARRHLEKLGLHFLTANYRGRRGEIDLIFRDAGCLVFVEVKARSWRSWTRPAAAVNARKKRHLAEAARHYLRRLNDPRLRVRFDIVEVLVCDGQIEELRHVPNAFMLPAHRFRRPPVGYRQKPQRPTAGPNP